VGISDDKKLEILTTLIQEDREEARGIRGRIETVISSVVVASFAITGFWFEPGVDQTLSRRYLALFADLSLLVVIHAMFWRSMVDLRHHRKAQKARQDLLREVANGGSESKVFDPFPDARGRTADLKDLDMIWLLIAGSILMVVKAMVFFRYFNV
jgi:hypothetical protein